jgi:hypothetical protein
MGGKVDRRHSRVVHSPRLLERMRQAITARIPAGEAPAPLAVTECEGIRCCPLDEGGGERCRRSAVGPAGRASRLLWSDRKGTTRPRAGVQREGGCSSRCSGSCPPSPSRTSCVRRPSRRRPSGPPPPARQRPPTRSTRPCLDAPPSHAPPLGSGGEGIFDRYHLLQEFSSMAYVLARYYHARHARRPLRVRHLDSRRKGLCVRLDQPLLGYPLALTPQRTRPRPSASCYVGLPLPPPGDAGGRRACPRPIAS